MAVACVLAGLGLRFALAGVLGQTVPYITFFPAVMFAGWFGGLGPGILATLLSLGVALSFVISASGLTLPLADTVGALVFVGVSGFISVLNEALRRSQQELRRARDLFQTTLVSIGDAVIATDVDARVTFLNAVAEDLTGWSRAEAMGKPILEVFPIRNEHTGQPADNPVAEVLEKGVVVRLANHTVLACKGGAEIPIEDSAAPIRDERGNILGVILVFRDVVERKQSEESRQRSEERLKLALDAGQIGVWDWDVRSNRVEWSDRVYEIHGVERGKFGGGVDDFASLIHPEDRPRVNEAIGAALHHGSPYEVEFRVIHPNGEVHWVATTAQVFRNEKGEPVRMLGATTDITPRKQAEADLRRQWHTFDTALSYTPDFTYTFDLAGHFTYINRALLSLWQLPLEAAVGKNFFELGYPPELAGRLQRQIQQVIDTRQPVKDQTPFTGPTGETRHYEYIFVPVFAADGSVEAVAGSTRDMTERIQVEEALRKSEESLTFALEAGGSVGAWDWDIPNDRMYCKPKFAALFSIDPERAAAGTSLSELVDHIHPDDRGWVAEKVQEAVRTGGDYAEEYRVVQPDGSVRWIYARGQCHLDADGNPTRFPGVAFDTTDHRRSEEALRESQSRLRAMYDGTYEYIGLLAPDGTLLETNRAALTFAHNTREELIGRPFWKMPWFAATPGAPEAVQAAVVRAAAGEFVRFEISVRHPSGEFPTFDLSFHPVRNERGEVSLIVPEGRNITGWKRAEDDLRRSNEELKRVNRELEEFAYVASHDLQEPLRMVNIYTQIILNELGGEGARLSQYAGFVRQGVTRMEALIRDLLTFSSAVHAGEAQVATADLTASLREALSVLEDRIEDGGSVITAGPLPVVRGDTSQLAHVFQNLLSNALKYCRSEVPPQVRISAERNGREWIVSVRDNGIGFEPQYSERIFGLFKRLHKTEYPGTGLGLAICKRIVERYGGRIWAEGNPGEGAAFHFALPTVEEQ
jgi:PAS domain S-box-containing protein